MSSTVNLVRSLRPEESKFLSALAREAFLQWEAVQRSMLVKLMKMSDD